MFLHYTKQSTCLREISFTRFNPCSAVTSGIRFCGKISIFSIPSAVHPSVDFFLVIASPPRPPVGFFFETSLRCSPSSLVVSARKWFRPVDKSLIFSFVASPPVRPVMIPVCQKNNNKKKKKKKKKNNNKKTHTHTHTKKKKKTKKKNKKKKNNNKKTNKQTKTNKQKKNNKLFIALSSELLDLYCQQFIYTILFITKNI